MRPFLLSLTCCAAILFSSCAAIPAPKSDPDEPWKVLLLDAFLKAHPQQHPVLLEGLRDKAPGVSECAQRHGVEISNSPGFLRTMSGPLNMTRQGPCLIATLETGESEFELRAETAGDAASPSLRRIITHSGLFWYSVLQHRTTEFDRVMFLPRPAP